jgi:HEAT repeat protein
MAPPRAKWRNGVMALLARRLLNGAPPFAIRQRLAKALIQTGDPGVVYFLRQAADHVNIDVRVAALEALGHLAGEADLPTLEIALDDPEPAVQEAAVAALGTMGGRAAIHRLTRLLIEAEQELRVKAALALARCKGEAWEILQEALQEEDLLTRRAAVYGLAEIPQPWARDLLVKTTREDSEWIVRSAAETALEAVDAPTEPVEPPLEASEAGWLISWAAQRNEPVGRGEAALPVLLRALEEGEPAIQRAAIRALGLIGRPEHVPLLRQKMEEGDPETAAIAMEALRELAQRHDIAVR